MNMTLRGVLHTYIAILLAVISCHVLADGGREQKAKQDTFRAKLRSGISSEVTTVAPVFPGAKLQIDDSARNLTWTFEVPAKDNDRLKQHYVNNKPSLVHGAVRMEVGSSSTIVKYQIYNPEIVAKRQALMNDIKANPPTEDFMGAPLLEGMTYNADRTFALSVGHKPGEWIRSFDYAFDSKEFNKVFQEKTGSVVHRYRLDVNPVRVEIYTDRSLPSQPHIVEYYGSAENASKVKPYGIAKADFDAKTQASMQAKPAAASRLPTPQPAQAQNQTNVSDSSQVQTQQQPTQQAQQQTPQQPASAVSPANVINGVNMLKGLFGR
jgi:hypothetical protein